MYSRNLVSYADALEMQRTSQAYFIKKSKFLDEIHNNYIPKNKYEGQAGTVFLLQHSPIYTLGKAGNEKFLLDPSIQVTRVERGGEVTFHGPGQLVGYLIFDLNQFKKDLHWMLRNVEEVIISTIQKFGIEGSRVQGKTGVWVGNSKIAAIGLSARNWVTMHGFALNVHRDCLTGFEKIVPCGILDGKVTCIQDSYPLVNFDEVQNKVIDSLINVFNIDFAKQEF